MSDFNRTRRTMLKSTFAAAAVAATSIAPGAAAQEKKLLIGYWPIAAGLPFYSALNEGMFKSAGVNVEAVRFAGPNQVVEALIAGRIDGCANGVAITALALADALSPGLLKLVCLNFADEKYVLDQVIVPAGSSIKSIKELSGKKVACGPGINNITLAKTIMERSGNTNVQVVELPIGQLIPALAAGQVDAAYVLEPTAVIGRIQGFTRSLGAGVVSRYALGDPNIPWIGGAAALSATALKEKAALVPGFLKGYDAGVDYVRKNGLQANKHLTGYTALEGAIAKEVPVSGFITHKEVQGKDIAAVQKLFDLFTERKVIDKPVNAAQLLYKA
jgi:NitT/TauT family transport system substrate-binding protein